MTFQQLEYIVAVDKHRHFVNAATACGVTQATLSGSIQKLEEEIDVIIFDRSKRPIEPTALGKRIISQAQIILHNSADLRSLVQDEKRDERGALRIGMLPSVAPYLYPAFARLMRDQHAGVETFVYEAPAARLVEQVHGAELDMAFLASPMLADTNLLELELYQERFVAYVSPAHPLSAREWVRPEDLQDGDLWVLADIHDRYPDLAAVTHGESLHRTFLQTGSLSTLVALVDACGGYTLLPALYDRCLDAERAARLRPIQSPRFFRTVSLAIRRDYMRERLLNVVVDTLKQIVPQDMLVTRLKKFDKITL